MVDRVRAEAGDGVALDAGPFELALINPPTHAKADELERLLAPLASVIAPSGRAFLVVSRPGRTLGALHAHGAKTEVHARGGYAVIEAAWS